MTMWFRIALIVVCDVALIYLIIRNYKKHETTLTGLIIDILFFIGLFIICPVLDNVLSYDDSNLAMLIIYGAGMSCEAIYDRHRVKLLTRKIRVIKADK